MTGRSLRRDTKGSTAVEFAIVGWMLCMVTFAIVETGLLWWTKAEMQTTASAGARCGSVGYTYNTTNCVSSSTTQAWVLTSASSWMFGNLANNTSQLTNSSVTVNGKVAGCNGAPGNYFSVTLTSNWFSFLPPPLGNYSNLSTTGCYPMP
jgi:Flp pilus assembly protein TadG